MEGKIFIFGVDPINANVAEQNLNTFLSKVDKIISVTQTSNSDNVTLTIIYHPYVNTVRQPAKKIQNKT